MPVPKPTAWLFLLAAFYAIGHMLWYWQTPLGLSPVLDGQENLILAQQIRQGTLPQEPFYRAMLYPALLAVLPIPFPILGVLCHLANAWLVLLLARRLWGNPTGALVSAALVAFNPVLLHFAVDPLDITLAITLFLGSLLAAWRAADAGPTRAGLLNAAASGLLFTAAALARPHFFAPLATAALALLLAAFFRPQLRARGAAFTAATVALLAVFGSIQLAHSGSFRILPWQGAYNLWANNNPDANGLYFKQSLNIHYTGQEHQNPTRLEAEELYRQQTGSTGSIEERSAYWRRKTFDYILSNPLDWLQLMAFKAYATVNGYEQYNNKTYAFHKERSPWLRYNPIGWTLLLLFGVACAIALWPRRRIPLAAGALLALAYAAGIALYMASARFRLPLVPLLAIACGGLPLLYQVFKGIPKPRLAATGAAVAALAILALSNFGNLRSTETFFMDELLLSDSAAKIGDDLASFHWANEALQRRPDAPQALRLRLIAYYNLRAAQGRLPGMPDWSYFAPDLAKLNLSDPQLDFVRGIFQYNLGQRSQAAATWRQAWQRHGWAASDSYALLRLTHPQSAQPPAIGPAQAEALAAGQHKLLAHALRATGASDLLPPEARNQTFDNLQETLDRILPQ